MEKRGRYDRLIYFVVGATLGFAIAGTAVLEIMQEAFLAQWRTALAAGIAGAVILGGLAARYGEAVFDALAELGL